MSAALRKGWCPGALRPMEAKDGLLVRLRLTGGVLPAATARVLADLAKRHGNGLFDLSARGNLQMRGVRDVELAALQDGLRSLGLLDETAAAESVRNVVASPLAGLHDGIDIRPVVAALERRLVEDNALHALPGKFGFLIDDGTWPTLAGIEADVRFDWTGERFAISVAGTRDEPVPIGDCIAADLVPCAAALAGRVLALLARHRETQRMRDLVKVLGVGGLAKELLRDPSPACGRRWPDEVGSDEGAPHLAFLGRPNGGSPHPTPSDDGATFSRKQEKVVAREIVGSQSLNDGAAIPLKVAQGEIEARRPPCLSFVGLAVPFGRLDANMLRDAAAAANESPLKEVRLTPWRAILIPGVEHLAKPLAGFITDPDDPRLAVAACVGAAGCARGTTDPQADAAVLAGALPPAAGIALHISGCEKGCAKSSATLLTLVARDGRYDLVRKGRTCDRPIMRGLDLAAARAALALEPV